MFSLLPHCFQIPPRSARPPLPKGAFESPPLAKEGQGGFRQQYQRKEKLMTLDHLFIATLLAVQSLGTMYALVLLIRGVHDIGEMLERVAKALGQSKQ